MKLICLISRHREAICQGAAFFLILMLACGVDGVADLVLSLF